MSTQTIPLPTELPDRRFAGVAIAFVVLAAIVAGLLPVGVSIVAVFLCAGPHNWVEARYFLSRLPARWGKLTSFFTLGLGGVAVLTGGFASITYLADSDSMPTSIAIWNTVLALWIATLVHLRSSQNPRREWGWFWPVAFGLIAGRMPRAQIRRDLNDNGFAFPRTNHLVLSSAQQESLVLRKGGYSLRFDPDLVAFYADLGDQQESVGRPIGGWIAAD